MKILAFILLFTFSLSASANFSGKYSGTGKAKFKSGNAYDCYEIFLNIKENSVEFRLFEGGYRCGGLIQAEFDSFKFTIENGNLLHEGEIYGSVNEKELTYSIFDPADGSTYTLRLIKTKSGLHYLESWHDGEEIALTVEGQLSKKVSE